MFQEISFRRLFPRNCSVAHMSMETVDLACNNQPTISITVHMLDTCRELRGESENINTYVSMYLAGSIGVPLKVYIMSKLSLLHTMFNQNRLRADFDTKKQS